MNINEYKKQLERVGDFVESFAEHDGDEYINDIISKIADGAISIRTYDQIEYAFNHPRDVDEAFFNGIAPEGSEYFKSHDDDDFRGYCASVGAAAWYEANTRKIYDNLEACLRYAICDYLQYEHGHDEININDIDCYFEDNNYNNIDSLNELFDDIEKYLGIDCIDEEE